MDGAGELRERLQDLVVGEQLRPGREDVGQVEGVGDADPGGGVRGEGDGVVGGVGEGAVFGHAEGRRLAVRLFGSPDQAADEVLQQGVGGQEFAELGGRPAAAGDHGLFQAADLVGRDRPDVLLQGREPLVGGRGQVRVVLGAGLGEGLAGLAGVVGDDRLQLLVEGDDEAAGAVVEREGAGGVQAEVGDQAVGQLVGGQFEAGRDLFDLLLRAGLEALELHPLRDRVEVHEGGAGADGGEDVQAGHGLRVAALPRPRPDHGGKAADGLVVAGQRELGERPALLRGRAAQLPPAEQRPAELREGRRVAQLADGPHARVRAVRLGHRQHRQDVPDGVVRERVRPVAQEELREDARVRPVEGTSPR
nr:hypothetical protein [Actinomadura sp. CNU-125]